MNYTEVYINAKTTLCKAIAERIPDEYLHIVCLDPLDQSRTFCGVYKSCEACYVDIRLAGRDYKSESIYELSVDQAYEVLKAVMVANNGDKL